VLSLVGDRGDPKADSRCLKATGHSKDTAKSEGEEEEDDDDDDAYDE
jgi:hypothetical protein